MALKIALLLGLLIAITSLLATFRGLLALKRAPMRGQYVDLPNGASIHVECYGDIAAPPVLLIHGMSGSTYDLSASLVPALMDDFRVYVVDRPGFGHSKPYPRGESLKDQADIIKQAIETLDPRKPVVLGQSYGGAIALQMAIEAPDFVSALVLVSSPSHIWPGPAPFLHRALTLPVIGPLLAILIAAFVPDKAITPKLNDLFAPQAVPLGYQQYFQPRQSLRPRTARLNARQRLALRSQIDQMHPQLELLKMPIESLHGTQDVIVGYEMHAVQFDKAVASNTLTTLNGMGHMPHHHAVGEIHDALLRCLKRVN